MKTKVRIAFATFAMFLVGFAATPVAFAQAYPSKPIRVVVPFPAGGVADLVARTVGQKAGEILKQPIVVENKPGASAIIGSEMVARAAPDGYTLLVANLPVMSINQLQYTDLPYSAERDFAPVIMMADQPYIIAASRSVPVKSMADLIELGRKVDNKLSFGSASSSTFLAGELLKQRAQIQMTHIPYKGSAPAINDLLGGHISILLDPVITLLPHVKSGKVTALAVTSSKRIGSAPEIPAYTELGLKDLDITSWQGIVAPARTPTAIIQRLNEAFDQALKSPEVVSRLQEQGATPVGGSAEQFARFVQGENKRWSTLAKQVGFQAGPR